MRADWTASGACTSGSTAPPRGATRRASGGAGTTSTTRAERDVDVRTAMARRRGVVPRHVGRDDGGDDAAVLGANAVALPPGRRQDRRDAPGLADRAGGRGVLLPVDRVRNGRLSAGRSAGGGRDIRHR